MWQSTNNSYCLWGLFLIVCEILIVCESSEAITSINARGYKSLEAINAIHNFV